VMPPLPPSGDTVALVTGTPRRPDVTLNGERRQVILELLSQGCRPMQAAKAVGVTSSTMRRHLNDDPDWREAVEQAQREAVELAEQALWKLAIGETTGVPQFEALRLWLMNRAPDQWKDPRNIKLDVSGQVEHLHDSTDRLARIAELEATLTRRRAALVEGGVIEAEVIEDLAQ